MILVLFSGCKKQDQNLGNRITSFWSLIEKKDFNASWEYMSARYKKHIPKKEYLELIPIHNNDALKLKKWELIDYEIQNSVALVTMRLTIKSIEETKPRILTYYDAWILENGEWKALDLSGCLNKKIEQENINFLMSKDKP